MRSRVMCLVVSVYVYTMYMYYMYVNKKNRLFSALPLKISC